MSILGEVDTSESYQSQMLKRLVSYAEFLCETSCSAVDTEGRRSSVFLDTKSKSIESKIQIRNGLQHTMIIYGA